MNRRSLPLALVSIFTLAPTFLDPGPAIVPRARAGVAAADDLPSWNDGAARSALVDFVARVTTEGGPDYVPPPGRVATFDNDGTLWCEQPVYVQAAFALDRARVMVAENPRLGDQPAFRAILTNDRQAMARFGEHELGELVAATHSGMTPESFLAISRKWLATAEHPRYRRLYKDCLYQPQLELLAYLRARGFKTFIVTGGGIDFVRAYAEDAYGVPPEQVVGSSTRTRFEEDAGQYNG